MHFAYLFANVDNIPQMCGLPEVSCRSYVEIGDSFGQTDLVIAGNFEQGEQQIASNFEQAEREIASNFGHRQKVSDNFHQKERSYPKTGSKHNKCPFCEYSSYYTSHVKHHIMRKHTGERPEQCQLCPRRFTTKSQLNAHTRTHLRKKKRFVCQKCGLVFTVQSRLQDHISNLCGGGIISGGHRSLVEGAESFGQMQRRDQHYPVTAGQLEKKHKCPYCKYSSYYTSHVKHHVMQKHTGERPEQCEVCLRKFTTRSQLNTHRRVHTKEKKAFSCYKCGEAFAQQQQQEQGTDPPAHDRRQKRNHKCPYCDYASYYTTHLRTHIMKHTGERPEQCDICMQSSYSSNHSLPPSHHVSRTENTNTSSSSSNHPLSTSFQVSGTENVTSKFHHCPYCSYKSYVSTNVKQHIKFRHTKNKPFSCNVCQKRFTLERQLIVHMRHHTGERPFKCCRCGKEFIQKCRNCFLGFTEAVIMVTALRNSKRGLFIIAHFLIESTTTSLGVFHHCPYCLYKNPILAHVRRHIMYKHTREKPFQCSFCLMRCTQKRDLQIHLRKHTGEKPYECSKCFRKFSTNSGLNKHLRNKKDCI
ncbi:Zinc finger protein 26 [Armadillidium vulgare]|nr:Zinc finger protein 26 [Armadillidium vulgare]